METTAMPKKLRDDRLSNDNPVQSGREPPPLSEDLIAKLQMAVDKARQKHTSEPPAADYPEHPAPKL
jgi:hypothetical protein